MPTKPAADDGRSLRHGRSRRVITSVDQVPAWLIDAVITEMATRMTRTPEARRTQGLSFSFELIDRHIKPACYRVGLGGEVTLLRGSGKSVDFVFRGTTTEFDTVLSGRRSPLIAILRRRLTMSGSPGHLRELLRLMPAVESAYRRARADLIAEHSDRYDFRI